MKFGMRSLTVVTAVLMTMVQAAWAEQFPVKPVDGHVYARGMLLGKPMKGQFGGTFWKTFEMHLILGSFNDNNLFGGNTIGVSTEDAEFFSNFNKLDETKNYVFEYFQPYPFHFYMQSSDKLLLKMREPVTPAMFATTGIPFRFDVEGGKVGSHTPKGAETKGRIVAVERWNTYFMGRAICTFILDQGGSHRSGEHSVPNEISFNIYTEQGCKYVESILPYGVDVKVIYSVAYNSMDGNDNFAHSIEVEGIPGLKAEVSKGVVEANLSILSRDLLADPAFQAGVMKLIEEHLKRMTNNTVILK